MKDLSKLNQRWYFFDKDESEELIQILKNHFFGEYIRIFHIEVTTSSHFKFHTLWRLDERFGNEIRDFDLKDDNVLFNDVYDFIIQREIRIDRILKLREIGLV